MILGGHMAMREGLHRHIALNPKRLGQAGRSEVFAPG